MLIGFTGTQSGMTTFQKHELRKILKMKECSEFMQGDCIGADEESVEEAIQAGVRIFTVFPPDNTKKRAWTFDKEQKTKWNRIITPYMDVAVGPSHPALKVNVKWMPVEAYLERNKRIVDTVSLMIAAPKEYVHTVRSGTWSTIRYAWKTKRDIIIIPPVERPLEDEAESNAAI